MANDIDIGLFSINTDHLVDHEALAKVAIAAEQAGFESLWTAELSFYPTRKFHLHLFPHTQNYSIRQSLWLISQRSPQKSN